MTPTLFQRLGLRGSLLLAFLGICGFVVLASGAALQALLRVGSVLTDVTTRRTPAMVASLDLSRQVERFVASAQQLAAVESREAYQLRSAELNTGTVLAALDRIRSDRVGQLKILVGQFTSNLAQLDALVNDRLDAGEQKAEALHELLNADMSFQYATRPLGRAWYSDAISLDAAVDRKGAATTLSSVAPSVKGLLALTRLRRIEVGFARAHDLLLIGATAGTPSDLQLDMLATGRALAELDQAVAEAPPNLEGALHEIAKLRAQLDSPDGALLLRKRELDDRIAADQLVGRTRAISQELMTAVDAQLQSDSRRAEEAAADAAAIERGSTIRLLVAIGASLICSALIVWLYVNRRVVARLAAVRDRMLSLARGDLIGELPPAGEDEIGRMAASLKIFRQTAIERDEREAAQRKAEEKLKRTLADVGNLLDNSGEGFLSFGRDLAIDPQCSHACETLLGVNPAGRNAAQVLFGKDRTKGELLKRTINAALDERDAVRCNIMLSLLPGEISRGAVLLKVDYKALDNGHVMVVLTDITEERRLTEILSDEHRHLSMVVAAVTESGDFFDAIDSFRKFLAADLPRMLETGWDGRQLVQDVYREVHTCKGVLGQFSFARTPDALHTLEEKLAYLAGRDKAPGLPEIVEIVRAAPLDSAFEADLGRLRRTLGAEFLSAGARVSLTADQVAQLEELAARLLEGVAPDPSSPETRALLDEIIHLRKVALRDLLLGYGRVVSEIADRLEKEVAGVEVAGGEDVWIDPEPLRPFLRTLIHVFRNAVTHGIEDPETRVGAGKGEAGRITCAIAREGECVRLVVADDGGGIDPAKLRSRAVGSGVLHESEVERLSDNEVLELIFEDRISTRDCVDSFSGRGVGLAAVRAEARKLGGEASVESAVGEGTRIIFLLPLAPVSSLSPLGRGSG